MKIKRICLLFLVCIFLFSAVACGQKRMPDASSGLIDEEILEPAHIDRSAFEVDDFSAEQYAVLCDGIMHEIRIFADFKDSYDVEGKKFFAFESKERVMYYLNDEGNDGDETAGDGIYTGIFRIMADVTAIHRLELCIEGYPDAVKTNALFIRSYTMESFEECKANAEKTLEALEQLVPERITDLASATEETTANLHRAMLKALYQMKESGEIYDYRASFPNYFIDFGLRTVMYSVLEDENIKAAGKGAETSGGRQISFGDVIVILPYGNELGGESFINAAEMVTNNQYLSYDLKKVARFEELSAEIYKSLNDYRVILINSHGAYDEYSGACFDTGLKESDFPASDIVSGSLIAQKWKKTMLATPFFFSKYYQAPEKHFDDALFYVGCCSSGKDSFTPNCLFDLGVKAYVGYTDTVSSYYDKKIVFDFFAHLSRFEAYDEDTTKLNTYTAADSIRFTKEQNGEKDPWLIFQNTEPKLYERDAEEFRLQYANTPHQKDQPDESVSSKETTQNPTDGKVTGKSAKELSQYLNMKFSTFAKKFRSVFMKRR